MGLKSTKNTLSKKKIILNVIGIILCIILIPILVINCFLIVKGITDKHEVPSIGGNAPLIVLTGSMDPTIKAGDLIVTKKVDAEDVKVGDVISFFDPDGNGSTIVTHRVVGIEIDENSGETFFRTKGDNNDIADMTPVPVENLVGRWEGTRFWGLGRVVLFTQSTVGIIVIIAVIVAGIFVYMLIRKRIQDKETDLLKAELAALKAAQEGEIGDKVPSDKDGTDGE